MTPRQSDRPAPLLSARRASKIIAYWIDRNAKMAVLDLHEHRCLLAPHIERGGPCIIGAYEHYEAEHSRPGANGAKAMGVRETEKNAAERRPTQCPTCHGALNVDPDPYNARFILTCPSEKCEYHQMLAVRPSAFSLLGVVQLVGAGLCGAFAYFYTQELGPLVMTIAVILTVLLALAVLAFILRLTGLLLLRASIPFACQRELIAYLAPSPLSQKRPPED